MLALFSNYLLHRLPWEIDVIIARVSLDQSVRLQESNERLTRWLIVWTVVLVALTLALVVFAFYTIAKS